jgi:mono/diheme cytochrome c family protein
MKNREQGSGIRGQGTTPAERSLVTGRGFSRAVKAPTLKSALAAEGMPMGERSFPQGINARAEALAYQPGTFFNSADGTAKAVPFQNRSRPSSPNQSLSQNSRSQSSLRGVAKTLTALAGISALLLVAGCRQDMQDQPKLIPQRGSNLFADHRGARPQVVNTVARGQLREDSYFYTGVTQGANGYREEHDELPFPATMEVLKRGQERFNIYCTPCHSRVGNGLGEIVQRGYKPAANLHDQVRLAQPLSHYFYVMSNGYGAMPDYAAQLTPADRWAVAAYIRALQLSQAAKESDVPSGVQVKSLKDVAASENLGAQYAEPWQLPATAVQPYPHDWKQGWPANAPANPADPVQIAPVKPATH